MSDSLEYDKRPIPASGEVGDGSAGGGAGGAEVGDGSVGGEAGGAGASLATDTLSDSSRPSHVLDNPACITHKDLVALMLVGILVCLSLGLTFRGDYSL